MPRPGRGTRCASRRPPPPPLDGAGSCCWDGRTVEIRITGKPTGASVVADNKDLAAPEQVEERRAQWKTALEGLQRHLSR